MASQPSMYKFEARPPVAAGDVAYIPEVVAEIDRLKDKRDSIAQMHARNFGRSAAIDMSMEIGDFDPAAVREITAPLAESFSHGLKGFFRSGVADALDMTVEAAAALREGQA